MIAGPFRRLPPLWFTLALAVLFACLAHVCGGAAADARGVQLAIFGWIVIVAQAIWAGVQVAAKITLVALHWVVKGLLFTVTKLGAGLKEVGQALAGGFQKAWQFLQKAYDD